MPILSAFSNAAIVELVDAFPTTYFILFSVVKSENLTTCSIQFCQNQFCVKYQQLWKRERPRKWLACKQTTNNSPWHKTLSFVASASFLRLTKLGMHVFIVFSYYIKYNSVYFKRFKGIMWFVYTTTIQWRKTYY